MPSTVSKRLIQAAERTPWIPAVLFCAIVLNPACVFALQTRDKPKTYCIAVEIYVQGNHAESLETASLLKKQLASRRGLAVNVLDLDEADNRARFSQICRVFRLKNPRGPLVYACRQAVCHTGTPRQLLEKVRATLRMTVYTRDGCPRCTQARRFLPALRRKYPGLEITFREVMTDVDARNEMFALAKRYGQSAASLPVFHFCNQLVIGYDRDSTTGSRLDRIMKKWTIQCPQKNPGSETTAPRSGATGSDGKSASLGTTGPTGGLDWVTASSQQQPNSGPARHASIAVWLPAILFAQTDVDDALRETEQNDRSPPDEVEPGTRSPPEETLLPLPPEPAEDAGEDSLDGLPLPDGPLPIPVGSESQGKDDSPESLPLHGTTDDRIDLPLFGELSAGSIGLPLFTIAVGLVDGFNPCAMWVLLFLLSVLVNLHDRWKILAVAGTFVCISGLAYFAFMAAWLNVFLLVGLLRWVQVGLGCLAIAIGSIHIKDFFAFKKGLSLSIPESAKPGLYARVRRIVTAESLKGAIAGAAVLAVLVNIIELLCTAGLPALYTGILTMHELPAWKNYAYLLLYNLAYMLDDGVMVTLVVVTLGRRKMQEKHGRWLKLLSGAVIAVLGVIMLFKPEWLG